MNWQVAVERTVTGMGYDLVDVERSTGGLLRVFIDRLAGRTYETGPGGSVTVDDCELVTRQLQYVLEVEAAEYARLEVSSPGLDRPLRKPADWQRFTGCEVELTLRQPFENRRKWRGELQPRGAGWRLLVREAAASAPGRSRSGRQAAARPADAGEHERALDFVLDEVREARLVPVLDFKGRAGQPALAGKVDGGQDR